MVLGGLCAALALAAWGPWGWSDPDLPNTLLFGAWLAALALLLVLGLRLPLHTPVRALSAVYAWGIVLGAVAVALLANVGLYRHDVHFDLTRERAFSPAPEAVQWLPLNQLAPEALRVLRSLARDVALTYFYHAQDAHGRRARDLVEILGRRSAHLHVRTVDPDRQPSLADKYGVRLYNVAVLEAEGRRLAVTTTDEREIALGVLRVLRERVTTVCFLEGHGEYSIDNFEFHTHFETLQAHAHGGSDSSVVLTERHGIGRMRRALESLGVEVRKIILPTLREIPADCAAVVDANPRTTYLPAESEVLQAYLAQGGAALLMYDLGFAMEPRLAAMLARLGLVLDQEVVVDPLDHHSTDEEMVAVPIYTRHPITEKIALTFYPGARPIRLAAPPPAVTLTPLFTSSRESYTRPVRPVAHRLTEAPGHQHGDREADHHHAGPGQASRRSGTRGPRVLAVAAEGVWPEGPPGSRPFRLVVVGDSDFASNSFFPYVSNGDLALAMVRWLLQEEGAPAVKPRVPVMPTVILTSGQMRDIFVAVEIVLPVAVALAGVVVWWKRR